MRGWSVRGPSSESLRFRAAGVSCFNRCVGIQVLRDSSWQCDSEWSSVGEKAGLSYSVAVSVPVVIAQTAIAGWCWSRVHGLWTRKRLPCAGSPDSDHDGARLERWAGGLGCGCGCVLAPNLADAPPAGIPSRCPGVHLPSMLALPDIHSCTYHH